MTQLDPKYVASTRPINRRTAAKQLPQSQTSNPMVQERLASIKARHRFGTPLAEQFRFPGIATRRKPLSFWSIFGSVLSALAVVAFFLAWIQFSWSLGLASAAGLIGGLAMLFYGHHIGRNSDQSSAPMAALFEADSIQAFDRVLDQFALEAPEELVVQLTEIKQQLVRITRLASSAFVDENFTLEDRMFLTESIRRYLPDSLQSYLMVPQNQRATQMLEQGQSAVALLLSQITLLRLELTKQEVKLTRSAAEDLLKQQRFLEAKSKR